MDKILDLFLTTPLAKRYAAGAAERGLILLLGAIGVWLNLDPKGYESDVAKFAAQVAPVIAGALLYVLAQKRMHKTEVTIETSRVLPAETPRALIAATVNTLLQRRQAPTQGAAVAAAIAHVDAAAGITQKVPPGTVDRTD